MPDTPYVSPAAFKAHPTYLDLDGLRVGAPEPEAQTAELANILLKASAWADNECDMPLGAHLYVQNQRARCDQAGMVRLHADHSPVLTVASFGYGWTPTALTTLASPSAWVEGGANMLIPLGSTSGAWSGSLQFGSPAAGSELFVQVAVVAGWVATQFAADASDGATSITVADPTGIQPGGRYRIWEPGVEETITVSSTWTPPTPSTAPAATAVTLASPLLNDHTTGSDVSDMPADMRLAVIQYSIALLMRPDTTAEDEFPDTALSSSTRAKDPRQKATGLVAEAASNLRNYARVR
jgi:hypothetical protein